MSISLRNRLDGLASSFAASVLDAIRGASLAELISGSSSGGGRSAARDTVRSAPSGVRRRRGRLARRSAGDIAHVIEKIVSLLKQHAGGLRAEQIREKLTLQAKELPRPLKEALDTGRLSKSGQKRATTYFVKGGSGPSKGGSRAAGGRRGRRVARKAARAGGRKPSARAAGRTAKRSASEEKKASAQAPPSASSQE